MGVKVADIVSLACGVLFFSQAAPLDQHVHSLFPELLRAQQGIRACEHHGHSAWRRRHPTLAVRLRGGASATVCEDREVFERSLGGNVGGMRGVEGKVDRRPLALETWGDWGKYSSKKRNGRHYWYNKRTRVTQWHDPRGDGSNPLFEVAQCAGMNEPRVEGENRGKKNVSSTDQSLAPRDGDNKPASGWELPKRNSGCDEPAPTSCNEELEDNWTIHLSKRNGQPYWFNKRTGKSRWTDPKVELEDAREEAAERIGLKWGGGKRGGDCGVTESSRAASIQPILGLSSVTTESQVPASSKKHSQDMMGVSSLTGEVGGGEEQAGGAPDVTSACAKLDQGDAVAAAACVENLGNSSGTRTDILLQGGEEDGEDDSDMPRTKSARRTVFGAKGAVAHFDMKPDAGNDDSDFLYMAPKSPCLRHELEAYVGIDKERELERVKQESYHEIWRRERADEVAQENFVNPATGNLKSSSSRIGGHMGASAPGRGGAATSASLPTVRVSWDSESEEAGGGGAGRIKVTDFLQQNPGAMLSAKGRDLGGSTGGGDAGDADAPGREAAEARDAKGDDDGQVKQEDGGISLPQTGFFRAGTMDKEGSRYVASSMKIRDEEEEEDSGELLKKEKMREQARQDREHARLAKLQGLLDGDFAGPPEVVSALGTGKTAHYTSFLRPARPQQAATNLYKNSGAPTAQNYQGRVKAGHGAGHDEEAQAQQELLRTKARAVATRFGGIFRRIEWDSSLKATIEMRPCWFACKNGHAFLATLADLEKHQRVWSHKDWCPVCEKKSKIKAAERFNGRPDESWAHFFERVEHIRPDSHRFAQSKMAAEQARLFETARQQVKDGTEKLEDWWNVDQDVPSKAARQGSTEPAAQGSEEPLSPAQEVERVLAFLRRKETTSGPVPIQSYNLAEICSLLGLRQQAVSDPDALRRHFRRIVLVLHPDKNPHPNAKDAFTAAQQAFEQLSAIQALSRGKK